MKLENYGVNRSEGTTSSGIKVVVYEMPHRPISLRATFRSGSRFDGVGLEGAAHIVEHLLVAGSELYPTKDKLVAAIQNLGGSIGAVTQTELLSIKLAIGEVSDLSTAAMVLNQAVCRPLFDQSTYTNEIGSVLRELATVQADANNIIWDIWEELVHRGRLMSRSTIGDQDSIRSVDLEQAKIFFGDRINGSRLTITAAGGLTLKQLVNQLDHHLELEAGTRLEIPAVDQAVSTGRSTASFDIPAGDQVQIAYGFRTVPLGHQAQTALSMLSIILGQSRSGSLITKLRYDKGLVYNVGIFNLSGSDYGSWVIRTGASPEQLDQVIAVINDELERVATGGVTSEELEFARSSVLKSSRLDMQTVQSWQAAHAVYDALGIQATYADRMTAVAEISLAEIHAAAKEYLRTGESYLALAGRLPAKLPENLY